MSEFQVSAGALAGVLKAVSLVVERKTTIPILSHVLLAANEQGLSVSATNLDMQMDATCRLVAPPSSPLSFTIDPRAPLAAIVNPHLRSPVTVSLRDAGSAAIAWEWGEMRLLTLPASDFPAMKTGEALAGFEVADGGLKPLDDVRLCLSTEETRYYLNGVFLDRTQEGEVLLVATDGHRLGAARTGWEASAGDGNAFKVIAPYRFCAVWSSAFRRKAHRFEFIAGEGAGAFVKYVRIATDALTVTSKIIDSTFPEWRCVVPSDRGRCVVVAREALVQGLNAATRFCRAVGKTRSASTTFHYEDGRAFLTVAQEGQSLDLDIGAARGPDGFWFGVNAPYLTYAAQRMEGDELTLAQADFGSPLVLWSDKAEFVVMPLRTEAPAKKQLKQAA